MKRASPWPPPEPSLFRKTPPRIRALDERRCEAARKIERQRAVFQATVDGVVRTSAAITALTMAMAMAMAAAAAIWWR